MFTNINYTAQYNYDTLLEFPNVVGLCSTYKKINNIDTDIPSLTVFVEKKIPLEYLTEDVMIPELYNGVVTDVVESGAFQAASSTSKLRPMNFGLSIAPTSKDNTFGTAGCMVAKKSDPSKKYILSTNHLLFNNDLTATGVDIYQPSAFDAPIGASKVAKTSECIPIFYAIPPTYPSNVVDCAIAELDPNVATPFIQYVGYVDAIGQPYVGQPVKKSGRTSGYTTGEITALNSTIVVNFDGGKVASFTKQIITTKMGYKGDSGALLLDMSSRALGLLCAVSDSYVVFNPIEDVLSSLGLYIVSAPLGTKQ